MTSASWTHKLRANANAGSGQEHSDLPRIDRVVLYIDDLDRCPPDKVLEVLEAVHLLLALELFIVIVGVDPHWLDRSLRHQYRDLGTTENTETDPYLQEMPTQYLEKIFHIPLTLPAMEPAAYGRLVASPRPRRAPDRSHGSPSGCPKAARRHALGQGLLTVQPGSAAAGGAQDAMGLTRTEVEFAQSLGHLLDTPRAAKRLMNTYRLIRSTRSVGSSEFLGLMERPSEFQAVLTLLAITAGYPTLADRVLVALEEDAGLEKPTTTWNDFVAALQPSSGGAATGAYFPKDLRAADANDNLAQWTNMTQGISDSTWHNTLTELEPYRRWGRVVARFSFTLQ